MPTLTAHRTHLSGVVIREVIIAEPHPQGPPLQLSGHQSIELQGGTKTSTLLVHKLNLGGEEGQNEGVGGREEGEENRE